MLGSNQLTNNRWIGGLLLSFVELTTNESLPDRTSLRPLAGQRRRRVSVWYTPRGTSLTPLRPLLLKAFVVFRSSALVGWGFSEVTATATMDKFLHKLRNLDAYPKINEDFHSRTLSGGIITVVSAAVMLFLLFSELSMISDPPFLLVFVSFWVLEIWLRLITWLGCPQI